MDKTYVERRDGGYYVAGEREVDAYLAESERRAEAQGADMNARARRQARAVRATGEGAARPRDGAAMRPRFQAGADSKEEIVSGLRRRHPEMDFQTAEEGKIRGLPDPEVPPAPPQTVGSSSPTTAARCPPTSPTSSGNRRARA